MRLGVNVDHVATVREARRGRQPDPVTAALVAEEAGADQITAHLREDRRHIQDRDVRLLRELVKTKLNLEMAATEEMIAVALSVLPDTVTLVPEKREELTTEGGLDVRGSRDRMREAVSRLHEGGIRVSLFVDPDVDQVKECLRVGADAVEISTGRYSEASGEQQGEELGRIGDAAAIGARIGLEVMAGHGLDYRNVRSVAAVPEIAELNIGHAVVARAVVQGMAQAVREMVALMQSARTEAPAR